MMRILLKMGVFASLILFSILLSYANEPVEKKEIFQIGYQVRMRLDATTYQNLENFSYNPGHYETQLLNRTRFHTIILPGTWMKACIEPQYYGRQGGFDNLNQFSLYQAYLELSQFASLPLDIKIGRQDFCYGSAFFLGNDDFYQGLTWDGLKIHLEPNPDWMVDLIAAQLVSFNDNHSHTPGLYGFYGTYKGIKNLEFDGYLFFNRKGFKHMYEHLPSSPLWFTAGSRITGMIWKGFSIEFEPVYQFGRTRNDLRGGDDQIRAWGGHFNVGYNSKILGDLSVIVSYAFGTGDKNNKDHTMQEFLGNVYNDTLLTGDISLVPDVSGVDIGEIRASGIQVFTIMSNIKPKEKINLNLDYHYFTAQKVPKGFNRIIGSEVDFIITYDLTEKMQVNLSANRFFSADIFRQATKRKKDIDYYYLQTQFEF